MPSYDRVFWALRTWLDSWSGIGHIAVAMQQHSARHRSGSCVSADRRLSRFRTLEHDCQAKLVDSVTHRHLAIKLLPFLGA